MGRVDDLYLILPMNSIGALGGTFVRPKLLTQYSELPQSEMLPQDIVERSFLGCPVYLLNAIQNISTQRDIVADFKDLNDGSPRQQMESILNIVGSIQKFDSHTWAADLPRQKTASNQETVNLSLLASSYKIGALIYGHRVLDACTGSESSQAELVLELIRVIGLLQTDDTLFKCILWPIFVAGLECQWKTQRQFLAQCLEKFWRLTLCFNVINAAEILNMYWQEKDKQGQSTTSSPYRWIFNMGRLGQDWLLI